MTVSDLETILNQNNYMNLFVDYIQYVQKETFPKEPKSYNYHQHNQKTLI